MKKLRIFYIALIFILFGMLMFKSATGAINSPVEANILKGILQNTGEDKILVDLSSKDALNFNILFKSKNKDLLDETKEAFIKELSTNKNFTIKKFEAKKALNAYKQYKGGLLSKEDFTALKNKNYEKAVLYAQENLYNPLSINFLPLTDDPFFFFTNYLHELIGENSIGTTQIDGEYYSALYMKLNSAPIASIGKVVSFREKFKNQDIEIYLTGTPVHTYFASKSAAFDINIVCIASILFLLFLAKTCFNSYKILWPMGLSIGFGFVFGYLITALIFNSIHVLTFVFATTLIGISVDYTLHFLAANKDINKIFKSLTASAATTILSFSILFFTKVPLLEQIAVFTSFGLLFVYLFVILFHPLLFKNFEYEMKDFNIDFKSYALSRKARVLLSAVIIAVSILGLYNIKFADDTKSFYTPGKVLLTGEIINAKMNNLKSPKFIVVDKKDVQKNLEEEENLTKNLKPSEYMSLSKFCPSIKRQKQANNLILNFYKKELNSIGYLSENNKKALLTRQTAFLTPDKLPNSILENFVTNSGHIIVLKTDKLSGISLNKEISEKIKTVRKHCCRILIPVNLALFLVLGLIFGFKNGLKILLPPFLACLLTLCLFSFLQVKINLFHILALYLIMGFSLDYSIFRFNENNDYKVNLAVLVSFLTSAFSFFLLSTTSFNVISSLGMALFFGLFISYLLSIFFIAGKN